MAFAPGRIFSNSGVCATVGIIELLENARDRRRGVRINAQFLAFVSLFGERFLFPRLAASPSRWGIR
jgi:hypothetical protein